VTPVYGGFFTTRRLRADASVGKINPALITKIIETNITFDFAKYFI
jgi:hypothetical protein